MINYSRYYLAFLLLSPWALLGQFAPAAGTAGSTAIAKDSAILVSWATNCTVQRGWMDISQQNLGVASFGSPQQTTGPAGSGFVMSLGDGGSATLTFAKPITNGLGADFAVFENSFNHTFLELAFVEVSSDGQNFVRFPAISNSDTTVQVNGFGTVDASLLYNLAGKYRGGFGTPFDLEELRGASTLLNINAVTHVRVIDAVGCLQDAYATRDSRGHKVNDPWSTPFASSGFDLDAVGVIHEAALTRVEHLPASSVALFPNPLPQGQALHYKGNVSPSHLSIYNTIGQCLWQTKQADFPLQLPKLQNGHYTLIFWVEEQAYYQSIIIL